MACPDYVMTPWVNGTAPAINADNLNNLERGVDDVTNCVIDMENTIASLEQQVSDLEQRLSSIENGNIPHHTHPISDVTDLQNQLNSKPTGSWSRSGTTLNIDIAGS